MPYFVHKNMFELALSKRQFMDKMHREYFDESYFMGDTTKILEWRLKNSLKRVNKKLLKDLEGLSLFTLGIFSFPTRLVAVCPWPKEMFVKGMGLYGYEYAHSFIERRIFPKLLSKKILPENTEEEILEHIRFLTNDGRVEPFEILFPPKRFISDEFSEMKKRIDETPLYEEYATSPQKVAHHIRKLLTCPTDICSCTVLSRKRNTVLYEYKVNDVLVRDESQLLFSFLEKFPCLEKVQEIFCVFNKNRDFSGVFCTFGYAPSSYPYFCDGNKGKQECSYEKTQRANGRIFCCLHPFQKEKFRFALYRLPFWKDSVFGLGKKDEFPESFQIETEKTREQVQDVLRKKYSEVHPFVFEGDIKEAHEFLSLQLST
ncbi:hypothetical protein [Brazilian marseillevirus]|uniref:hypothetical protein n=1 Tax=Brazilian marseillevirus TaxID=1813599 RepID=UPI000785F3F4|nr:hypothetical protein A3303_gp084 [Brazilian marseillevirus]AMQ10592.1 hypothetical protein [Brazilian marseillevirus]